MAKKSVTKLSDKLTHINENFTVYMYDNGFMFEAGGKDADENWKTAKIMVTTIDELIALVREATEMDRND